MWLSTSLSAERMYPDVQELAAVFWRGSGRCERDSPLPASLWNLPAQYLFAVE
jgi:hypothetical protein